MNVLVHLARLEESGLVRLAAAHPELEYLFRHTLVQDAAYASLLKSDRRRLHRLVGEALEGQYPDRLAELAPRLARHYDEADEHERAVHYYRTAGDAAAHRYANAEAILHYSRALELGQATAAPALLGELYVHRGRALELSGRYPEALENYRALEALARERGDRPLQLAAVMARATIRSTLTAVHDADRGQALSEQALALARELGDRRAEAKILWTLLLLSTFTNQPQRAVEYGEQSLAIARALGLREQLAYTLNDIFRPYVSSGQFAQARTVLEESRPIWEELGNLPLLADNYSRTARILFAVGEYDQAVAVSARAREISHSIGNLWGQSFCRMFVGYVYLERGEPATAIQIMEECIQLGEQAGFLMVQVGTRADLSWVYGTLGALEHAFDLCRHALALAEQRVRGLRAAALANLARLYVMSGGLAQAEAAVTEAYRDPGAEDYATHAPFAMRLAEAELALAQRDSARALAAAEGLLAVQARLGIRPFVADALLVRGRALLEQGRMDEAYAALRQAHADAEAIHSRRMLWPVAAVLSRVERERGNAAPARAWAEEARVIVDYIAAHCPADLRENFLNLPELRAVRDSAAV